MTPVFQFRVKLIGEIFELNLQSYSTFFAVHPLISSRICRGGRIIQILYFVLGESMYKMIENSFLYVSYKFFVAVQSMMSVFRV